MYKMRLMDIIVNIEILDIGYCWIASAGSIHAIILYEDL